jgi:stage II sporulation protein AA (anti-sigma F factor antagonist)
MYTSILKQKRTLLISPDCDIDHHSASQIRAEADRVLSSTGVINIAFDFSKVGFMDSSGIGMIIGRYRKVNILGGKLFIVGASPDIMRIIGISGLGDIVTMCNEIGDIQ